jgi:U3 small nucleolar RNA-associated protein 6
MAAASDKARFYMEQSVPELQEYERKKIFTREEITQIARKRSEFEHLLNTPGAATPADYARYALYEMNLDSLRKKRSKRMGVKATSFAGQKKIFFVLERGVRRFQGDMGLWMQYLEFCRKEAANKKLAKALTQCLRMHPIKWDIWTWAAKYYFEQQADMPTARSYMQRGLRFCKREQKLWLEYAKLEMLYVAKIAARRKILGLDIERTAKQIDSTLDADADMMALPDVTADEIKPEGAPEPKQAVDEEALKKLAASPALNGDIPRIVLETAMRDFNDPTLAEHFFDVFAAFTDVPCTSKLLQNIIDYLSNQQSAASKISMHICLAKLELLETNTQEAIEAAEFPLKLAKALSVLKKAIGESPKHNADLAEKVVALLLPYFKFELDEDIERVLRSALAQYIRTLNQGSFDRVKALVKRQIKAGNEEEATLLIEIAGKANPIQKAQLEALVSS